MNRNIVTFQALLDEFPLLETELTVGGFQFIGAESFGHLLEKTKEIEPVIVILDSDFIESPPESIHSLKILPRPPKLVWVDHGSAGKQGEKPERLVDVFLPHEGAGSTIVEYILANLSANQFSVLKSVEEVRRVAARIETSCSLTYLRRGHIQEGWAIDVSRSGVLLAVSEEFSIGDQVTFRFDGTDGKVFEVIGQVIRIVDLEFPQNGLIKAIGTKLFGLKDSDRDRLDAYLEMKGQVYAAGISPEILEELVADGDNILFKAFQREANPPELAIYLKEIGSFERSAFTSEGELSNLVRQMVTLRVQCAALRFFLPILRGDKKTLSPIYFAQLQKILDKTDAAEARADEWVRTAVAQGDDSTKIGFNETSNRLHQAKIKLLYAVDEIVSPEGLSTELEILQRVNTRVRDMQKAKAEEVATKFRRASHPAVDPSQPFRFQPWMSKGITALLFIALSIGIASLLNRSSKDVSISDLHTEIRIERVEIVKNSLVVVVQWNLWKNLPSDAITDLLHSIEKILKTRGWTEGKIIDERNIVLATVSGSTKGSGTMIYRSKLFQRKP